MTDEIRLMKQGKIDVETFVNVFYNMNDSLAILVGDRIFSIDNAENIAEEVLWLVKEIKKGKVTK